jgi:Family of unknown function (DUF6588)
MKKIFILMIILVVGFSGVFAQVNITDMQTSFSAFSTDVAQSLPFASTIGLNWSDATVRSFPHFGVGLTVGAVLIPKDAFVALSTDMGFSLPSEITSSEYGIPLPVYTLDGRIGGLFLPFDIGVKIGYLPPDALTGMPMSADYTLAGFDIRMPILKQNVLLPSIALSVGYNYLNAGVEAPLSGAGLAGGVDLTSMGLGVLSFPTPSARFQMESNVIDAKLQISKSLLIITPYLGVGYAYGWSKAGGGISGTVNYDGSPITPAQITAIEEAFAAAGYDAPTVSADGFVVSKASTGGSFRAFGGLSVNLFILKLDLNAMYNVNTESLGASANVRIAF